MTEIPIKEYVEVQVRALQREVEARLDASDKAVTLSQTTLTERLAHSNGLIEQMRQQSMDFARKVELHALAQRVDSLELARSRFEGTTHGKQPFASLGMTLIAAIIGAVVSYVAVQIVGR